MSSIPLIDISPLALEDRQAWQPVIDAIDTACRDRGFFYVTGHGVDPALVQQVFDMSARFFALPDTDKRAIDITQSPNHRGYGSIGAEQLEEGKPTDWKETFDMALHLPEEHAYVERCPSMYGPNRYPQLEGFQSLMERYYAELFPVAMRILKAMALALKMPEDFFSQSFSTHVTVLRVIHYPPRPEQVHDNGAGAHTDYGCITLLRQDQIGGLQVRGVDGQWIDATPIEDSYVVNIGDLMQHWTNDIYRSTAHRVVSPQAGVHRYSSPFFVEPDFDTLVTTLPTCIDTEHPLRYQPVTSGDWIQSRFKATYSYRNKETS
ncbi:2OG-Fe(II) oxygenase [Pokkaliibacter plantistimulans]|uniref:2-oxoglutarate-dependent ethylene/succinate-forming enzyme n=1 Tax=Pokkaliibacter plantistimulans TaxID=1635171 RepID=A0ABX5M174_9GAMM|nr:2-oxoglutarate and iron-dependent oxygenase domain-containing protein [Pokkaliibacter plantistimulans]PXF32674.1 2OG-Fe(II) oxygenase [Pokkaliibacter plantistimulans]